MIAILLFFELSQDIGQIEVLHVDVSILEILIEISDTVENVKVMDGCLKEVVDEVLKKKSLDMLVGVGRNLILLVVQLSIRRSELSVLRFDFFPLALFLTFVHYNSTIINP